MSYLYFALIFPVLLIGWFVKEVLFRRELSARDRRKRLAESDAKWFTQEGKLDLRWDPLSSTEDVCIPERAQPEKEEDAPLMIQRWRRAQIRHKAAQKRALKMSPEGREDADMRIKMTKVALDDMEAILKAAGHDISKL
jgi:hypothetical protein